MIILHHDEIKHEVKTNTCNESIKTDIGLKNKTPDQHKESSEACEAHKLF